MFTRLNTNIYVIYVIWKWKLLSHVRLFATLVHGILQARILEWAAFPFSRGLPNSGIEPRSPALQADSLPAESQGKPKNTRVDNLSLLQQIFPTQESNRGLLHCKQILYQLSYRGSPYMSYIYILNGCELAFIFRCIFFFLFFI